MNLTLHRLKKTRTEKADKDVMKVLADFPLAVLAGGAFKEGATTLATRGYTGLRERYRSF
jgi:hypothetical protein